MIFKHYCICWTYTLYFTAQFVYSDICDLRSIMGDGEWSWLSVPFTKAQLLLLFRFIHFSFQVRSLVHSANSLNSTKQVSRIIRQMDNQLFL